MVYVQNNNKKYERLSIRGKLIGISCKSDGVINQETGLFNYLDIAICREKEDKTFEEKATYIRLYGQKDVPLDMNADALKTVKKADDLLKAKKKPLVMMQHYTTKSAGEKDGEDVVYTNHKANHTDLNMFVIVREEA